MSIDRADWHVDTSEQEFREATGIQGELTTEQINQIWLKAANHIGFFFQWIVDRGFEGDNVDPEGCAMVRSREISGAEYLMEYADGKFLEPDVWEDVLPFVEAYYEKYFKDYEKCCEIDDTSYYGTSTSEESYKQLKKYIDAAYESYQKQAS